jgi:UDP-N-acetylglucosamine 2-epimerase (non-hydrolysing)
MSKRKIAVIIGTRPEGIKLAPIVRELHRRGDSDVVVISTGQHREMLEQALAPFDVRPDVNLRIMHAGQTLQDVTRRALEGIVDVFRQSRPSWVIVQGDTTTAFAVALAAFYDKIPVAHVEAGLRSGDRYSPFPEEINRRLIDELSTVLFAPTENARALLAREGFDSDSVHVTGNTVVDALLFAREAIRRAPPQVPGLSEAMLDGRRMVLVTAHRRESFGAGFESVCRALLRIADEQPDACIVYPVHLNPNVDEPVRRLLGAHPRITLLAPVAYLEFVALMDRAYMVLTDSGGVQEEAPTFGKPILVLRDVTERPEGIDAGVARLVGTEESQIVKEALALLRDQARYRAMARSANPYGDGHAAERIVDIIESVADRASDTTIRRGVAA